MRHDLSGLKDYLAARGAGEVDHGGVDFLSHLEGVYRYLGRWGRPEHVQLAGLFHSVYGSEAFRDFSPPPGGREEVRALVGREAERLVYAFCAVTNESLRRSVLSPPPRLLDRLTGGELELSEGEFEELLWLKLANTLEQSGRLMADAKYRRGLVLQMPFWLSVAERLGGPAVTETMSIFARGGASDGKR